MKTSVLTTHWQQLPEKIVRELQAEKLRHYLRTTVLPFSKHYGDLFRENNLTADSFRTLDDLQGHSALYYRGPNAVIKWQGFEDGAWRELAVPAAFISNDGASLVAMARKHKGLALLSEWGLRDALASGELVRVELEQKVAIGRGREAGIYLLYLQARYQVPKVRVAVEFLVGRLGEISS